MTGVLILFQGQITNNLQDNPAEKTQGRWMSPCEFVYTEKTEVQHEKKT